MSGRECLQEFLEQRLRNVEHRVGAIVRVCKDLTSSAIGLEAGGRLVVLADDTRILGRCRCRKGDFADLVEELCWESMYEVAEIPRCETVWGSSIMVSILKERNDPSFRTD